MVKGLLIDNGRLVEGPAERSHLLVYIRPDEAEKRYLVDELKIDEHTLNSALDPDELSRLEFEPEHVAVILKRPKRYSAEDQFVFKVSSTGVFLFKDRLIIAMDEDAPLFEGRPYTKLQSPQDVILRLIYRSIFHFIDHLRVINSISTAIENQINTSMENKHLLNLFVLEKSLVYYLNAISSNAVLIDRLRNNAPRLGFTPENLEFLDDIAIENNQCREQANIYSQVLAGLMDARASIVGNNLNMLMKTLNVITIAIMVPTFVVSAFSMNVTIPIQHHPMAFWIIMGLAAASMGLVVLMWRHRW